MKPSTSLDLTLLASLFVQKASCHCASLNASMLCFSICRLPSLFSIHSILWTSSMMLSTMSSSDLTRSVLQLSWCRPSVLSLDIALASTFFLPEICSNWMSNCCSSNAQWSSTRLDMSSVKNGASGF